MQDSRADGFLSSGTDGGIVATKAAGGNCMKRCWLLMLAVLCVLNSASADDLSWRRTGPVGGNVSRILPDRAHPGVFYLTGGPGYYDSGNELYRTLDNGQSWERVHIVGFQNVMVHPASSELFVLRSGRDYKHDLLCSKDQGKTFQLRSGNAPSLIFGHPTNPNILWGSGLTYSDQNLSISTDRGAHWQVFNNLPYKLGKNYEIHGDILPADSYYLKSVLVSPLDGKTVYVSTEVEFSEGCSYDSISLELVSTNDGKTWRSAEFPTTRYIYDPAFLDRAFSASSENVRTLTPAGWKILDSKGVNDIVSIPGRPDLLYELSGAKQWVSHDGGSRWSRTNIGPGGNARVLVARTSPQGTLLAGTSGAGIYIIDENQHTHQVITGFSDARVTDVASAPGSGVLFAIAAGNDDFLYRSLNAGKTWNNITDRLPYAPRAGTEVRIVVDPKSPRHGFVILNDTIVVTFDAGETWKQVPQKPLINVFLDANSSAVYFSKPANNHLYLSNDQGLTLQELPAEFGRLKNTLLDLAVDPFNGYFYVATESGLFVSRDAGQTAQLIGTDIFPECSECITFNQILALPERGQYFATTNAAIYKTSNQGVTWKLWAEAAGKIYMADDQGRHFFLIGTQKPYYRTGLLFESFDGGQSWDPKSATVDPRLAPNQSGYIGAMTDPRFRPLHLATTVGMFRAED